MGRKVHPNGFRLKVIRGWNSNWFAKGSQYADQLHEDFRIRDMIFKGASRNASISKVDIERSNQIQVTIHTARPGIVIGRKGVAVRELRQKIEKEVGQKVRVEVEEISNPDTDAKLVAENVAGQLARRISHNRAMKRAATQAMRQGALGIKIMVAGRLNGSEMARREWVREGRVPLQTLRADIDYGTAESYTTFGQIGVKVWIYKGDVLTDAESTKKTGSYVS